MNADPMAARLALQGLHGGGKGGRRVVQDEAGDGLGPALNRGARNVPVDRGLVKGLPSRRLSAGSGARAPR